MFVFRIFAFARTTLHALWQFSERLRCIPRPITLMALLPLDCELFGLCLSVCKPRTWAGSHSLAVYIHTRLTCWRFLRFFVSLTCLYGFAYKNTLIHRRVICRVCIRVNIKYLRARTHTLKLFPHFMKKKAFDGFTRRWMHMYVELHEGNEMRQKALRISVYLCRWSNTHT